MNDEKIIQLAPASEGVYALTNHGNIFIRVHDSRASLAQQGPNAQPVYVWRKVTTSHLMD